MFGRLEEMLYFCARQKPAARGRGKATLPAATAIHTNRKARTMKLKRFLRTYPLTTAVVVLIWVVCLIPIPETPLNDVTLIDKWVHIVMYFVLAMTAGHEHFHSAKTTWTVGSMALRAGLLPAVMGGLVELAQAWLTTCRTGDWLDFLANALGAAIGFVACTALAKILSSLNRS